MDSQDSTVAREADWDAAGGGLSTGLAPLCTGGRGVSLGAVGPAKLGIRRRVGAVSVGGSVGGSVGTSFSRETATGFGTRGLLEGAAAGGLRGGSCGGWMETRFDSSGGFEAIQTLSDASISCV